MGGIRYYLENMQRGWVKWSPPLGEKGEAKRASFRHSRWTARFHIAPSTLMAGGREGSCTIPLAKKPRDWWNVACFRDTLVIYAVRIVMLI